MVFRLSQQYTVPYNSVRLVHQALTGYATSHVTDDCCLVTNALPRRLRLADTRTLLVSRMRTDFGDGAFSAA